VVEVEVDTLVVEAMTAKEVVETQANGATSKVIIEWMVCSSLRLHDL
jgi:hypothetical protein